MTTQREIPVTYEDQGHFLHFGRVLLVKPGETTLPIRYKRFANIIYNFDYRRDDVCLFTFPKSGTVWTAGIIWAMTHMEELERAKTESLNNRVFYVDNDFIQTFKDQDHREKLKKLCPDAKEEDGVVLQLAALEKGRRIIWSHLPFDLQNPDVLDKCKGSRAHRIQQHERSSYNVPQFRKLQRVLLSHWPSGIVEGKIPAGT
ncbi:uncharacterized protein LOC135224336 isoform X2 [Macrobrachium nipponense]|uniref:uncharacterized protein LOC135224336 isoform X2 n=1 Tax=Macrobrachium nipponense TaxID=159736 RepID=UPI0030C8B7BA